MSPSLFFKGIFNTNDYYYALYKNKLYINFDPKIKYLIFDVFKYIDQRFQYRKFVTILKTPMSEIKCIQTKELLEILNATW